LKATIFIRRVILFLAILLSGGSLIFPRSIMMGLLITLCVLVGINNGKPLKPNARLRPVIALVLAVLILCLFLQESYEITALITRFTVFIGAFFVFNIYSSLSRETFQRDLFSILKFMPYQAIITVVLGTLTPFLFTTVTAFDLSHKSDANYIQTIGYVFNYHVLIDSLVGLKRPDGFFWEPGIFQIYLNLFLYLSLFVFKNKWYTTWAVLGVFATQSTTGVIIALILFVYFIFIEQSKKNVTLRLRFLFVGIFALIPLATIVQSNIDDKLNGETQGSSWARQYDLLTGINVILQNPITGIGFDYNRYHKEANLNGEKYTQLDVESVQDRDNTNGIILLLYSIGIPLSIPFLMGLFRSSLFKHNILIGSILVLALSSESIIFTPFFLLIIYNGVSRPLKKTYRNKANFFPMQLDKPRAQL
jgi:hypothetical protein